MQAHSTAALEAATAQHAAAAAGKDKEHAVQMERARSDAQQLQLRVAELEQGRPPVSEAGSAAADAAGPGSDAAPAEAAAAAVEPETALQQLQQQVTACALAQDAGAVQNRAAGCQLPPRAQLAAGECCFVPEQCSWRSLDLHARTPAYPRMALQPPQIISIAAVGGPAGAGGMGAGSS